MYVCEHYSLLICTYVYKFVLFLSIFFFLYDELVNDFPLWTNKEI